MMLRLFGLVLVDTATFDGMLTSAIPLRQAGRDDRAATQGAVIARQRQIIDDLESRLENRLLVVDAAVVEEADRARRDNRP